MNNVRLPRLLGPDLTEKARPRASNVSARINMLPLSTASVTLPEGEETANIHDFMEIYGPDGSLGVFRIASAQKTPGNQQQLTLEHGIVTLEDDIAPNETKLSGSMKSMLTALLSYQNNARWKLGDVEVATIYGDIDVGMYNLLEALLTIVGQDDTAMMVFDQSAIPWVLHIRKKPSAVSSECRLNRNMSGVNILLDDSELCTRVTVEDAEGVLHTYDADTIGTWGVVHKAIAINEGDDPEQEGRRYLAEHKNPSLSVEIEALALARMTGEPLDSFDVGRLCRTALPEWSVVMDERVVSLAYPDLLGNPEQVKLTLSSGRKDASTRLASLSSTVASNTRSIADNHKYYKELDNKAIIMAGEIELRATKDELGKYLNEVYIVLDAQDASIELNAQHIDKVTHEITAAGERIDGLNATLTQYAGIVDAQGNLLSGAVLRLDGLENTIDLKVSKGDIISAINLSTEGIVIQASKINLSGYVTASQLEAEVANINRFFAGSASATRINANTISATSGLYVYGTSAVWLSKTVLSSDGSPTTLHYLGYS